MVEEEEELGRPICFSGQSQGEVPKNKAGDGIECGDPNQAQEVPLSPVQVTLTSAGDLWPQAKG